MSNLPDLPWEQIDNNTKRLRVKDGWLVLHFEPASTFVNGEMTFGHEWRPAMAFVPDPMSAWKL